MDENASVCVRCGVSKDKGVNYCPNCGSETTPEASVCVRCGAGFRKSSGGSGSKSKRTKLIAIMLLVLVGEFGVHDFYLGYKKRGIIKIILIIVGVITSFLGVGCLILIALIVWLIIDLINIITGKMTDANGNEMDWT